MYKFSYGFNFITVVEQTPEDNLYLNYHPK